MDDYMDWLYFYLIQPTLERIPQGEYKASTSRIQEMLSIPQETDWERAVEFYATSGFILGFRSGTALTNLCSEE